MYYTLVIMALLRHIKAVKAYMANTLVGPVRDQAVAVQSKQLHNLVKRSKLSLAECTEASLELQSIDTFPADIVEALVLAVGLRAGVEGTSELGVGDKMQDFTKLYLYLTQEQWFTLKSDIPDTRVMEILCEIIRMLGGRWLSEQTFKHVLALYLLLTKGKEQALNAHSDDKVRTDYQTNPGFKQLGFKQNRFQIRWNNNTNKSETQVSPRPVSTTAAKQIETTGKLWFGP